VSRIWRLLGAVMGFCFGQNENSRLQNSKLAHLIFVSRRDQQVNAAQTLKQEVRGLKAFAFD
jgi:hypothetical protein